MAIIRTYVCKGKLFSAYVDNAQIKNPRCLKKDTVDQKFIG
ncbi:hypothetical protein HMPREF0539_1117 [Lacticaseibacillus rhamnosus LMS2-1]|uniref:Uncharacterized protein n=1 Tax=Lacticaseibacillus rhamnosus (strain LMS2-1) TaxID=525361 RepID=C2JW33_LACRM|nr:conserved hypothetical protein [Lacticaseibacillus rhamnosus ATCC 8530]EEN80778.1 hypothetical protein HMPREF0539_1117 [Lacticaseibacillus rhamnosus LMS2-1]